MLTIQTRKENPYLDRARFPRDWATAEIVKQYLCNQRKRAKKVGKTEPASDEDGEDADRAGHGNNKDEGEDEEEDEDENGGGEDEEGEGEERRRKRRRVDHE